MAEAQQGFADMKDVDEGTFERYVEWSYKGYYTPADFKLVPGSSQAAFSLHGKRRKQTSWSPDFRPDTPSTVEAMDAGLLAEMRVDSNAKTLKSSKKDKRPSREELRIAFIYKVQRRDEPESPKPRPNLAANEDYTEVFLSHARLYVFADQYLIQPLKVLAVEELRGALALFTLYPARTSDILALLEYVYGNTLDTSSSGGPLRKLLKEYVAIEMRALSESGPRFVNLMMCDNGPLLTDFMKLVAKRVD